MAALEGSYHQNFSKRQTLGVTLPVMEPRESVPKRDRPFEGTSNHVGTTGRGDRPHSGPRAPDSPQDRPHSRSRRPRSRGEQPSTAGSTPERPSSALARGVTIMEHTDAKVNPEPVISEEAEILLEEYLSPRKLRALTGVDELDQVHYLEMKVDTRDTSLGNFGSHLPNLSQLKLSNSIISTVRDLGSCLDSLKVLWMARCGVEDLDGLPAMTNLRELYLAYNEISDISPCSMLENLQILDLEGNNVDNLQQIHFLSLCMSLQNLTLEGNPVCVTPSPDEADPTYDYRATVKSIVPQVKLLDDEPLLEDMKLEESKTSLSLFEDDWKLIEEMMDEGLVIGAEDNVELDVPARPGTSVRPTTSYRPGSALKPYSALTTSLRPNSRSGNRPGTGSGRPATGASRNTRPSSGERPGSGGSSGSRPGTAANRLNSSEAGEDDTSDLTMGGVVCGNPSKALRARRAGNKPSTLTNAPKLRAQMKHKPEHSYDVELEDDENLKELLSELKTWKHVHHQKQAEISASKAPQVLRIDHDEAEDVSGNEVSTDEGDNSDSGSSVENDKLIAFRGARPKRREKKKVPPKPQVTPIAPVQQRFKSPASMRRMRQTFEESHEANDDDYSPQSTPPTPPDKLSRLRGLRSNGVEARVSSPLSVPDDGTRPYSGPESLGPRKFNRLSSPMEKAPLNNKAIDRANPVIRASTVTPERVTEAPRAGTSCAALMQPPSQLNKIRKGQLANVQLLPSRFPKHKEDDIRK